jgi:hypothetical protein
LEPGAEGRARRKASRREAGAEAVRGTKEGCRRARGERPASSGTDTFETARPRAWAASEAVKAGSVFWGSRILWGGYPGTPLPYLDKRDSASPTIEGGCDALLSLHGGRALADRVGAA